MLNRIYFAHHALGFAPMGTTSFTQVHGAQDGGLSTNFELTDINEIGQLSSYESVEDVPQVEITLEKVLDGYPLLYHLATPGATTDSLAGRGNQQSIFAMSVFDDDQDSASGTPVVQFTSSGVYCDSLRYEFPSEGPMKESVTLRGDHGVWTTSGFTFTGTLFDDTDEPLALTSGLGGVQFKENLKFVPNLNGDYTILPHGLGGIPGISSSGTNDVVADVFGAHISQITVSCDLNREDIKELGRRKYYFRSITFPVDVTTEITVTSTAGNQIDALPDGVISGQNVFNQQIVVVTEDSTKIDLGYKNKLTSVTWGGAGAGGGNAVDTYSYRNKNTMVVSQDMNPG